jgi:hypothetical protein
MNLKRDYSNPVLCRGFLKIKNRTKMSRLSACFIYFFDKKASYSSVIERFPSAFMKVAAAALAALSRRA